MSDEKLSEQVAVIIAALTEANWRDREAIKESLMTLGNGQELALIEELENVKKGLSLEVRWEIEEVVEALTPVEEVEPEEESDVDESEPEESDEETPLSMSDLVPVFDDPRGLVIYRSKEGGKWFASQVNPNTGQPQLFQITEEEVSQLRNQLAGSPYWILGAGGVAD